MSEHGQWRGSEPQVETGLAMISTAAQLLTGPAGKLVALALIVLLILKEMTGITSERWRRLGRALTIGIIPLSMAFVITVAIRIAAAI